MKRYMIWLSAGLALVLVIAGIAVARAAAPGGHKWCSRGWALTPPRLRRSRVVRDLASEAKAMDSAAAQGNLDESKAQAIAARQAETIGKVLVEKERFKSKVYSAVLNSEQRSKADELEKKWEFRLDQSADRLGKQPAKQ